MFETLENSEIIEGYNKNFEAIIQEKDPFVCVNKFKEACTESKFGNQFEKLVEDTFDQYTGLRQFYDFRGLETISMFLPQINKIVQHLNARMMILVISFVEKWKNFEFEKIPFSKFVHFLTRASNSLIYEFCCLKTGVLIQEGYLSSLTENVDNLQTVNSSVVLQYIHEVMTLCDENINELTNKFNSVIKNIEQLSSKIKQSIFKQISPSTFVGDVARNHLKQIKPWACSCIRIHTQAFIQREVFAKSKNFFSDSFLFYFNSSFQLGASCSTF